MSDVQRTARYVGVSCGLSPLVAAAGLFGVPFGFKPPGTLLLPGVFVAVGVLPTDGSNEVMGAPELLVPMGAGSLELEIVPFPPLADMPFGLVVVPELLTPVWVGAAVDEVPAPDVPVCDCDDAPLLPAAAPDDPFPAAPPPPPAARDAPETPMSRADAKAKTFMGTLSSFQISSFP